MKLWLKKDYINLLVGLAMFLLTFTILISFQAFLWTSVITVMVLIILMGLRVIFIGLKRKKYNKSEKLSYIILGAALSITGVVFIILIAVNPTGTGTILFIGISVMLMVIAVIRIVRNALGENIVMFFKIIDTFMAAIIIGFSIVIIQDAYSAITDYSFTIYIIILFTSISRILVALFGDEGPAPIIIWAPPTEDYIPKK